MEIAILNCDKVDRDLAAKYGEYGDMFVTTLSERQTGLKFTHYDALHRQLPDEQKYFDGYIITGSRHNSYDNDPWIIELIEWVRSADRLKKHVAGICFGHQLIARALGATVKKSEKGWGLGSTTVQLQHRPDWLNEMPQQLKLWVSHQDQVQNCPPQCQVIAKSDFCPIFMLAKQSHIFTVQGHPEFIESYTEVLLEKRRPFLTSQQYNKAKQSLKTQVDSSVVLDWILAMFAQNAPNAGQN
ncbi:glutamine amidotransferase-related protein [Celerinatantimonas diazotrophica]|uniref:GMP synthase-like glutamine amidotransferase n=1 Tax=Celerinatantimonas diazotrophica TaxID=412034 RepID=A0A4R1KF26_9GAMM|nr:homoserine O-succinyltransferase [Celerinatantimonas diazotrophica]TCK63285.1 GMP synthase-like glutamine amidotransferase [Celerinatantimonas diazotrophica]CAG9298429.1 hypothetical protein CEDIAZO_03634 [Celerinatantimonas diazotrophica]